MRGESGPRTAPSGLGERLRAGWRRALRHRGFVLGLAITGAALLTALLGPLVSTRDPYAQDLRHAFDRPSWGYPFGRDEFGRDLYARVIQGSRYTLGMGTATVAIGLLAGVALGSAAGYYGGMADTVVMRAIDLLLAFPSLLLAIAIVSILGPGLVNLVIAVGVYSIPQFARLVRGVALALREQEYILAARAIGVPDPRIIARHLLPGCVAPVIVQATFSVAAAVLAVSGLSFLGLGAQPPLPEWGVMLSRSRGYMRLAPHVVVFPGLAIVVVIIGLNLIGDGLRDLLDPRLRRVL